MWWRLIKTYQVLPLIADNVFKLLNLGQNQNTCNNINKNSNSIEINGLEKNGYTTYNKSLKQTDGGILNNPSNDGQSDISNPITQPQPGYPAQPQSPNINIGQPQFVKLQSDDIAPTQSLIPTRNQFADVKNR